MPVKAFLGNIALWVSGWKSHFPEEYRKDKMVLIAAPHTSNWDLFYAMAVFWKLGISVKYFIKDAYTKGLHGYLFKSMGAIGVDRKRTGNLVHHAAALLEKNREMVIMVPAEGTRKRVDKWKTGFYHIALKAKVPVGLGYLDYGKKEAGVGKLVYLTGDFEQDMAEIEAFYRDITAKYPEQYNPKIF